jgi:ferredoxin-nitrate reductase
MNEAPHSHQQEPPPLGPAPVGAALPAAASAPASSSQQIRSVANIPVATADTGRYLTRNSILDVYGARTPYRGEGRWPERVDERHLDTPDHWVQSVCILCSNGCGMDVGVKDGRMVAVRGRGVDRVNRGRLGPKGLHGWVANHSPDRLTRPLIRRDGRLVETTWDEAMDAIVRRSRELLAQHGPMAMGFYNTGQLFIEDYYALSIIQHAGIGTPHMDGNTRLCTATAEWALEETFGTDGQPGSYGDVDVTDAIFQVGHNTASQQTVLWMRILDRRAGPNPPKLIVVDPRATVTAKEADVHLAPRVGTNVALLNGLLHCLIRDGHYDRAWLDAHTVGFDDLLAKTSQYPPARLEQLTGVPARQIEAAAEILGTTPTLVSSVLQGVYQSNQATAAACQVNNIHLLRGLIGRPGSGVLQMNGQPTAQNTRETGTNGSLPAFLNRENPRHMAYLARYWNVDEQVIPDWQEHTHVMEQVRLMEQGAIKFWWVICTNPAVSLPELHRIRRVLENPDLFLVVQDAFLTETAQHADVVLPAAIWGEKTGTFTNTDRTVHLSEQAIAPPGEARMDMEIFIDYARRMDFRDKDGAPLIKFHDAEGAFDHFKGLTRGRPCDYSGLSYAKLRGGSGVQWPCNEEYPDGCERLYPNHAFNTDAEYCESYGHDIMTGALRTSAEYKANNPAGRAVIKAAEYEPPKEQPDADYPLWLTTGRVVYHWHTRTKSARSPELNAAAPDVFVQLAPEDASQHGIVEGDWVEVESRRGKVQGPARIGDIVPGHVFVPWHYGYFDAPGRPRAANELTLTMWDPVSKQPHFKYAAVRLTKLHAGSPLDGIGEAVERAVEEVKQVGHKMMELTAAPLPGRKLDQYLGLLRGSLQQLANAFTTLAERHANDADVAAHGKEMAGWCLGHLAAIKPLLERYGEGRTEFPDQLRDTLFNDKPIGGLGLLRDLHDTWIYANNVHQTILVLGLAGRALRDREMEEIIHQIGEQTDRQIALLQTQIKARAAQALLMG